MSTAPSSAERQRLSARSAWERASRAATDVIPLLQFRGAGLRGRSRTAALFGLGAVVLATLLAGWLPAHLPGAAGAGLSGNVLLVLPSAYLGVLVVSIVSAVASGGGRELLPRDQAVAFPVSVMTDHLGALLMAPLNITWLVQGWAVLGATAFVVGGEWMLLAAQVTVLAWLLVATATAQAVAWVAEWVRRGSYGAWLLRALVVVLAATAAALVSTVGLAPLLDRSPTVWVARGAVSGGQGDWLVWLTVTGTLAVLAVVVVLLGGCAALRVARRSARDELRAESSMRPPRVNATSDFAALVRVDRLGIWRSVPLRRGLVVLATLPGLAAVAGDLGWQMLATLPALAASGGGLLFGVNSWCLDGRGALWRDSLPVSPAAVFGSRAVVLVEVLLLATALTLALASLRAGAPTASQLVAVVCAAFVVILQVVACSLRWSVRRPFAVDMRGARATPAPPLVMVGYSTRLAVSTTLTGLIFTITAQVTDWRWSVLVAGPFLLFSAYRLRSTAKAWAEPEKRARVITTVAS